MNCDKFDKKISLYIDNKLNDIENREFELHLMKCNNCRVKYENMINMVKILREEEQVELPEGYRSLLKEKLIEASQEQKRKINWKFIASIAAALLVVLTSYELMFDNNILNYSNNEIGLKENDAIEYQQKVVDMDEKEESLILSKESVEDVSEEAVPETNTYGENNMFAIANDSLNQLKDENGSSDLLASRGLMGSRKTVKEAYVDITVSEFDTKVDEIINFVNANNGFVESIDIDDGNLNLDGEHIKKKQILKIRISQDKFEDVLNLIKDLGLINNCHYSVVDITDNFDTVNSNLTQLYYKEERLVEILNKLDAEEEKAIIEEEIVELSAQIEDYSTNLQEMQDSSSLSTINVTIKESEIENADN